MKTMYADATKVTGPLCVKVVRPHAFEPKLIQRTMRPRLNGPGIIERKHNGDNFVWYWLKAMDILQTVEVRESETSAQSTHQDIRRSSGICQ
jgi:hypothetical protein